MMFALLLFAVAPADTLRAAPLVIAHRGASGHRPEHTLAAYELAIAQGADCIEPDLVATKDGHLVARHEPEIGGTTDVARRFPERRRTMIVDGDTVTGWFTTDFTRAELRTLRARERTASRSHAFDGRFGVPTFDEVLALLARVNRDRGVPVCVVPELKHPHWHRAQGLDLEPRVLAALRRFGLDAAAAPVIIQSFEPGALQRLRAESRVRLLQLLADTERAPADADERRDPRSYRALATRDGLASLRPFADAVGVEKSLLLGADSLPVRATTLVPDAHHAGLVVHAWTVRTDAPFLGARWSGNANAEIEALLDLGVDGLFADQPDEVLRARQSWLSSRSSRPADASPRRR